ncbi:hypothetical protein BGZ98_000032 [Dissophora globulifera]|nr:hypothetical protein BGZ98_000032 [Dissophora globulifera]
MLFNSTDITLWESILAQYPEALEHHVASKKDDSLLRLDHWYQITLPSLLTKRKPKCIDSDELCQLMSWKLKRGKFRPSLAKLAASNADADVKRISQDAFALIASDIKAAITKMAELKGVGPATASAILCAGAPSKAPFMADETMDSVPGLGTIAYTIPYYLKFATKVIEKAAQLKAKGSTVDSPHLVEKVLWADYMLNKYGVQRKGPDSASLKTKATTQKEQENSKEVSELAGNGKNDKRSTKRNTETLETEEGAGEAEDTLRKKAKKSAAPLASAVASRSSRSRS